jgi:hypothetical protein
VTRASFGSRRSATSRVSSAHAQSADVEIFASKLRLDADLDGTYTPEGPVMSPTHALASPTSRRLRAKTAKLEEGSQALEELKSASLFASKMRGKSVLKDKLRKRGEQVLRVVKKRKAKKKSVFSVLGQVQDRREELRNWGCTLRTQRTKFEKQFAMMDRHQNGKVQSDVFAHVLRRIGLVSDRRLKQLLDFLDPNKTGFVRYKDFMKDIVGEWAVKKYSGRRENALSGGKSRAHGKEELHPNPFLAKTQRLLAENPLATAKKLSQDRADETQYQAMMGKWMKEGLSKSGLLEASKRRRDFDLFVMRHFREETG